MDADAWDARYAAAELVWSAAPNRFVADFVGPLAPRRALDLACGEGRNAIWMAAEGWETTGVDFSGVAIDKARRLAEAEGVDVTWIVADAREQIVPPHSFDLVLLCYLQLPEPDLRAVLARAGDAVAPGGIVLVIAHARANLDDGVGGPQDPAVLPTPAQLADWLGAIDGLVVERSDHVRRPVETPEGVVDAIDVLAVALRNG